LLGFKGRLDFLFRFHSGKTVLVDIKTPAAHSKTWCCQLAAYEYLLKHESIRIDAAMSLQLKSNGGSARGHTYHYRDSDLVVFLSALNAHRNLIQ
jgi:hypothetical protein